MNPSQKIDELIANTGDWRGTTLSAVRRVILGAAPDVVEEWKWMGSPTWYCHGLICVANPHKGVVRVTFQNGAHVRDRHKLFNADLDGNQRRAIKFFEKDVVNEPKLTDLIKDAIAFNLSREKGGASSTKSAKPALRSAKKVTKKVTKKTTKKITKKVTKKVTKKTASKKKSARRSK